MTLTSKIHRPFGVALPLAALRSAENSGAGEFLDLPGFARFCAGLGINLIQLLPVNDTGPDSSPYSALSAFALHPLYLRISALPEAAAAAPDLEQLRRRFSHAPRFPYGPLLEAKLTLLQNLYAAHQGEIAVRARSPQSPLHRWITAHPWVKAYGVFRCLKQENHGKHWKHWASHQQVPEGDIDVLWEDPHYRERALFWAWLQEALDTQFQAAAAAVADAGVILKGDLPILMNEDSCDVWLHPHYFHRSLRAGAPPDMYSPEGQHWGFPLYDWEAHAKDHYAWWKQRLHAAAQYYHAYRIDHVLGFFRLWAVPAGERSAILGRFIPAAPLTASDLRALGFDEARLRWLSQPHIPSEEVWAALNGPQGGGDEAAAAVFSQALERIGAEELWLFKDTIHGEPDIEALGLHPAATACLLWAWRNRLLLEYEPGRFAPLWFYRDSRAYASLSEGERAALEDLLERQRHDSELIWEAQGRKLLSVLTAASPMLACAEDLGAVPPCVPRVLEELGVLGLRVIRWCRDWDAEGQPYIPLEDYPELSVCTPSVHDSSTLREWWDREAEQERFAGFIGFPSLPKVYNPGTAKRILHKAAAAASRLRVFPIQDLLHLSPKWYAADAGSERINVPGSANDFNWTYRLPASAAELAEDADLIKAVAELAAVKRGRPFA